MEQTGKPDNGLDDPGVREIRILVTKMTKQKFDGQISLKVSSNSQTIFFFSQCQPKSNKKLK